jgi:hypothetical protein
MYFKGTQPDLVESANQLARLIHDVTAIFQQFGEVELQSRSVPGKWSKKEILGHLIDSAINNLKRFTEMQFLPSPYQLRSYQQEELVIVNHYQELPITHLVQLWKMLNQQILFVIEKIPPEKLKLKWQAEGDDQLHDLDLLIADYVSHLEHHLMQIRG